MCAVAVCRANELDCDAGEAVVAGRRPKYAAPSRQDLRRRRLPPIATTSRDCSGTHVLLFALTTRK